jgi:carbamoyl-phosphate synthase large subunit
VPFASKATGVNLVDAAVRLAAGARLHELELPEERRPELVSVKAAVLPFARFPGSDPVLGPEMRSTGEVMASAADLPTAFAKAERAAGRPLPNGGTAFLSVRELDAIRAGRCDLVVNTPQGSGARRDGALIRQAALSARVPCITTLSGARLAVDAIANAREEIAHSLQERIEQETRAA